MPNPSIDDPHISAEIKRLVAIDWARAMQIIGDIPAFIEQVTATTVDLAVQEELQQYTVSAPMMRLNWTDSREKPGLVDNFFDYWPEGRLPEPSQFLEAPWLVFEYCRKAGYEPFVERGLYRECGLVQEPDANAPPQDKRTNSDCRTYFFYIGIRWIVNLT